MVKNAYPYPEDDKKIKEIMTKLAQIDKERQKLTTELRMLVYKAEQP